MPKSDDVPGRPRDAALAYRKRLVAREISAFSRYYDAIYEWDALGAGPGGLLTEIDCPERAVVSAEDLLPDLSSERDRRSIVLLDGVLNHHHDIQRLLSEVREKLSRTSRVVIVAYNPYYRWLYEGANRVGLRDRPLPTTFLTRTELAHLSKLTDFEIVRVRPAGYCPGHLLGVGDVVNHVMPLGPGRSAAALVWIIVLRPVAPERRSPSLSIVVPAKDERGNIAPAVERLLFLRDRDVEVNFVEGHSSDGTWDEILRVKARYSGSLDIRAYRQSGKGKNDAVRLGFSVASKELLTILDADLTMPPELLPRFYDAYVEGRGDFVQGNRLLYPMEDEAMRYLNRLGNVFFAKALSSVLGARFGDTLCGTKLLAAHDYRRVVRWREDFGDFDPFGDFELLFPAAILGLGIVDVPIRYRSRTYGSTNIHRFRHGAALLHMTGVGLRRIATGRV